MAQLIREAKSTINLSLWLSTLMGIALIGGGIGLVYLGERGSTELTLFGNSFKSTSVGAVGIFCGAVIVASIFRISLKSLDHISMAESPYQETREYGGIETEARAFGYGGQKRKRNWWDDLSLILLSATLVGAFMYVFSR